MVFNGSSEVANLLEIIYSALCEEAFTLYNTAIVTETDYFPAYYYS